MDLNDPQLQAIIAAAASAAVSQYVRDNPAQPGPPGERGPPGTDGLDGGSAGQPRWNPSDVGFFNPMYEDKSAASGAPSMEHTPKETYFRDVHLFLEHARDVASLKGDELVRTNLWTCLKGPALEWWLAELSENDKRLAKLGNKLDEWERMLIDRFKSPTNVAIDSLLKEKYTLRDAANRREPREYAQRILRASKDAKFTDVRNQLDVIYNGLDSELRRDIRRPKDGTTLQDFLSDLDDFKHDWWTYASRHGGGKNTGTGIGSGISSSGSATQANRQPRFDNRGNYAQSQFRQQGFGFGQQPYYGGRPFQPYYSQQQSFPRQFNGSNAYSNQNQQPGQYAQQSNPPRQGLPAPRQPLQITESSSGSTNRSSNQQNPRSGSNFGKQGNRGGGFFSSQRQQGTAYQAESNNESEAGESESPSQNENEVPEENREPDNYYADEELDYYQPRPEDESAGYFAGTDPGVKSRNPAGHQCRHCLTMFSSKNELHKHLGNSGKGRRANASSCPGHPSKEPEAYSQEPEAYPTHPFPEAKVIKSSVDSVSEVGTGQAFRQYHYAMAAIKLKLENDADNGCLDTGCSVSLMDRSWLVKANPELSVKTMASPITVRGLGSNRHQTSEYVVTPLLFPGNDNITAMTSPREIHIVDDLKANLLIGMDIMVPEKIDILASQAKADIGSCQTSVPIEVRTRGGRAVTHPVHVRKSIIIPPRSEAQIPVHHVTLPDRDFFFEPEQSQLSLYAHLVNASMTAVLAKNDSDQAVKVPRNLRLGTVQEADFDNCYHVTSGQEDVAELATRRPKKAHQESWIKRVFNKFVTGSAIAMLATGSAMTAAPAASMTSASIPEIAVTPAGTDTVLPNGVTIHGNSSAIQEVANEFPTLWEEGSFAKIPEPEWMRIPLKSDWEQYVPKTARVYPLGRDAREIVDKTFDKLHKQGRLSWTKESTPFSYPVFVVWKTMPDGTRKGRAVVDIRGLNAITRADVYPLPLQTDLISSVKDCRYISVIDCASFFYQWRVHWKDRHKLTVVSHRGQETFNVAVMGYKNSPAYVQRQIDRLLRRFRAFARAYVDDVVIYSKTLEEHVHHLREVFSLFMDSGISVNPSKAFLGYPSVQLLGQKVDSLGLWTAEDKLQAISKLSFPTTLSKLETYLGMTGWLRDYVAHYAAIAKPLQDRKTAMLSSSPRAGNERKTFALRSCLQESTNAELASFQALQKALSTPSFLVHFDEKEMLYIDLDASKDFGFGAMIYHVVGDVLKDAYPLRSKIRPILFLSRLLRDAETRYWPTELELAGIVWVLGKVRHMVESAPHTVVYTDHGAALGIAKQTTMTTSSTAKLNLRLIRASEYIQRFRSLEFRHKPGKQHIVPDALSRLS